MLDRLSIRCAALILAAAPLTQAQAITVFNAVAADAAGIAPTVDAFRAAAGALNPNDPVNGDPAGRRQIDWDGAPDAVSDPNPFPRDFFNGDAAPRARGIEFRETGATAGFLLSATEASGQPVRFGFGGDLSTFSPERLFTPVGGTTLDVIFFDPADQTTPATVRGLGVIFTDVEVAGSTTMTFFDQGGNVLAQETAGTSGNGGFSFVGVLFDTPDVFRIAIDAGNTPILGNGLLGASSGAEDLVAMDDFIFGEPIAVASVPLPATLPPLLAGLALVALGLRRRGAAGRATGARTPSGAFAPWRRRRSG